MKRKRVKDLKVGDKLYAVQDDFSNFEVLDVIYINPYHKKFYENGKFVKEYLVRVRNQWNNTYDLLLESNCWWSKYEGYTLSLEKSHIQDILENAISEINQMLSQLEVAE